jgi:Tetratricopeptide repeat
MPPDPAGSPVHDPHATIAMLREALDRMPGNADAMVGLAGVHLQLGLLEDAAAWCAKAITATPEPSAALRVRAAIGDAFVKRCTRAAIDGHLDSAISVLSHAADLTESRSAALHRDLFALAHRWFEDAAQLPREPGSVRVSIPVWGDAYVAAVCDNLLRSLLAPGNVPALAAEVGVKIEFSTRERDRRILEDSPIVAALRQHAVISFFNIPDHLTAGDAPRDFAYWVMSVAHYGSAERARRSGGGVSFLTADMVLADGSLRAARRFIADGASAVLVRALEVNNEVLRRHAGVDAAMKLAPDELVRLALAEIETKLPKGWGSAAGMPLEVASCAWFPVDGGIAVHGFHFLPLLLSPEIIGRPFAFDLLTVDTRFMRLALGHAPPDGRIKTVDDAAEIAVVSTMRAGPKAPPLALRPARLARWAAGWCFSPADAGYFDWCFRRRTVYRPGRADAAPAPTADEHAAVASVLGAFAAKTASYLLERQAESTGPL